MPEPTITIITPSFNQAPYLEETIRSILGQRDQLHEYFVIDGGSTDSSPEIIRKYGSQIDYWVSEKDGGQSDAIVKGFSRATGDFLLWLNSDDVLLPGALAKVRRELAAHPGADVLTGNLLLIDSSSRISRAVRYRKPSLSRTRWGMLRIWQQSWYFRRSLYQKVGGIDVNLHCVMDRDLWTRFLLAQAQWRHIPDYLGAFRIHETSKTSSWGKKWDAEHRLLEQRYPVLALNSRRAVQWGNKTEKLLKLLDGRYFGEWSDTRRWRGGKISDVFSGGPGEAAPTPA